MIVHDYRQRIEGCFVGKSVGGTLGGPFEGDEGPLSLSYYDPVPQEMLPNDDLDLQVVWMEAIRRHGLPINRRSLADCWLENIHMFPDEYAVAHQNILHGYYPPMSGAYDNAFIAGMGAAIRSEIWACLAPGCPDLAARLAREDACCDHDKDGVDACVFFAAVESLAFVENDRDQLIDRGLTYLPAESRIRAVLEDTRRWWLEEEDWPKVRARIRAAYAVDNWTDVVMNLGYILLGWLAGEGDFGRSICIACNCGGDTDCTAATLGALLGLINPDSIGPEWSDPIGRVLVLSPSMVGMHPCPSLDDFCDQLEALAPQVLTYYGADASLATPHLPADASIPEPLYKRADGIMLSEAYSPRESLLCIQPLIVNLVYPVGWVFQPGTPSKLCARFNNPTERKLTGQAQFIPPYGWALDQSHAKVDLAPGASMTIDLSITAPPQDAIRTCTNFLDIRFTLDSLSFTVSAGMAQPIPWQVAAYDTMGDTEGLLFTPAEVAGHTRTASAGKHCFITEFKVPHNMTACYLAQAKGSVVLWLDGKEVIRHDDGFFVPAFHRHEGTGVDVYLEKGWRRAVIWLDAKDETPLYFGIGVAGRRGGGYVLDMEWRMPQLNK